MSIAELIAAIAQLDPADAPAVLAAVAARLAEAHALPEPPVENGAYDDRNLTIEETAARMRRSTKWLYRHRATLPFVRKLGPRSYICSEQGLTRWLARRPS
jgi:hypothetical protein